MINSCIKAVKLLQKRPMQIRGGSQYNSAVRIHDQVFIKLKQNIVKMGTNVLKKYTPVLLCVYLDVVLKYVCRRDMYLNVINVFYSGHWSVDFVSLTLAVDWLTVTWLHPP